VNSRESRPSLDASTGEVKPRLSPDSFRWALLDQPPKAQPSIALSGYVQEDETIDHGELAPVHNGPESARCMSFEICDRHLAAGDERGDSSEQSDRDQKSCAELD